MIRPGLDLYCTDPSKHTITTSATRIISTVGYPDRALLEVCAAVVVGPGPLGPFYRRWLGGGRDG